MKKIVALMLTLAMCLGLNAVAYAQSTEVSEAETSAVATADQITPRTIVGSGSAYINGSGRFRVYCSGWSLFGKATITISDTSSDNFVNIQMFDSNGNSIIGGNVIVHQGPGVVTQNLTNLNKPYYDIDVYNSSGGGSRVSVTFGDR